MKFRTVTLFLMLKITGAFLDCRLVLGNIISLISIFVFLFIVEKM